MATAHTRKLIAEEILVLQILVDQPGLSQNQIEHRMGPPGSRSNSEPARVWLLTEEFIAAFRDDMGKVVEDAYEPTELGYNAVEKHEKSALDDLDFRIAGRQRKHARDGSTTPREVERMQYLKERIESKEAYRPEDEPAVGSGGAPFATPEDEVAELERRISAIKAREAEAENEDPGEDEAPAPVVRKKVRKKRKKKRTRRVNRPKPVVQASEAGEAGA